MNNFTNNPKRTPRQRARGKQTRGCEPSSLKLSLLFPILSVTDGDTIRTYTYHADGQLATASYSGDGRALSPRAPPSTLTNLIPFGNPLAFTVALLVAVNAIRSP